MKLVLIRHSDTCYNLEENNNVINMSLSRLGRIKTEIFAKRVKYLGYFPDIIITLNEKYCIETAEILSDYFSNRKVIILNSMKNRFDYSEFYNFLINYYDPKKIIFFIGTGVELVKIISEITREYNENIYFEKLSFAEIYIDSNMNGKLLFFNSFKDLYGYSGLVIFNKLRKKYGMADVYEISL